MSQRTANRPGCAPWCDDHNDGGANPADAYCRRAIASPTFGRLSLEHGLDGRPMVFAYGLNADELTPAQAAELRDALTTLIGAAA